MMRRYPKRLVHQRLVAGELVPLMRLQPQRIAGQPVAGVSRGARVFLMRKPAADDLFGHEGRIALVPLPPIHDRDLPVALGPVEVRIGRAQRRSRGVNAEMLGDHPMAELAPLEPGLEEGDKGVGHVPGALIEMAEVRSPGHGPHRRYAGRRQIIMHCL